MNPSDTNPANPSDGNTPLSDLGNSSADQSSAPTDTPPAPPSPFTSAGISSFDPSPLPVNLSSTQVNSPSTDFSPVSPFASSPPAAPLGGDSAVEPMLGQIPPTMPDPQPLPEQPIPTFTPPATAMPAPDTPAQSTTVSEPPAWFAGNTTTVGGSNMADSAPTDFSQLTNSPPPASPTESLTPPTTSAQPEIVVPAAVTGSEAAQVVTSGGAGKFPKWIIFAGVGAVIVVAAASAYFILGIGKSSPAPTAPQASEVAPPRPLIPVTTVAPTSTAPPSSLGTIQGGTPSALQAPASSSPSGTSAIDRLKARQQTGQ